MTTFFKPAVSVQDLSEKERQIRALSGNVKAANRDGTDPNKLAAQAHLDKCGDSFAAALDNVLRDGSTYTI